MERTSEVYSLVLTSDAVFIYCMPGAEPSNLLFSLSLIRWNGHHLGFPGGTVVKNLSANARDTGLIPGSGRYPGVGNPLQYSCLENSWTEDPGGL